MFDMLKSMDAVLIVTNSDYTDPSLKKMLTNCVEELRSLFAFKSMLSFPPEGVWLAIDPYIALVSNVFDEEDNIESSGRLDVVSPMYNSPPPMLSEMGMRQLEEVIEETAPTAGDKLTEELAAAMHIDFYRVSAFTGMGIQAMFERISRRLVTIAQTQSSEKELRRTTMDKSDFENASKKDTLADNSPRERTVKKQYWCFCIPRKQKQTLPIT